MSGIKQLSWEGIKPTREKTKLSICLRFIHTEATMSQREQRKLLFLSSRSQRNWMQARNIKHFANWRFGNYISNCRAISKEKKTLGDPQFWRYQKVQFLLWGLPARTEMNVGPIGRQKTDICNMHFRVTTKFTSSLPRLKDTRKMHNPQSRFCDKNWGGERWWLGWLKKGERNRSNDERKLNKSLKLQRGLIWGRKGYPSKMSFPIDGKEIRCLMTSDEKVITGRFSLAEGSN